MSDQDELMVQNLLDAGADDKTAAQFSALLKNGTRAQQINLLKEQRAILLDNLHGSQNRLDCLDYLLYTMKKKGENNE